MMRLVWALFRLRLGTFDLETLVSPSPFRQLRGGSIQIPAIMSFLRSCA